MIRGKNSELSGGWEERTPHQSIDGDYVIRKRFTTDRDGGRSSFIMADYQYVIFALITFKWVLATKCKMIMLIYTIANSAA